MNQYYPTSTAEKIRSDRINDLMEATRELCWSGKEGGGALRQSVVP